MGLLRKGSGNRLFVKWLAVTIVVVAVATCLMLMENGDVHKVTNKSEEACRTVLSLQNRAWKVDQGLKLSLCIAATKVDGD